MLGALLATAVLSLTGAGAASAAQPAVRTGAPVTGSAQSAWARGMWVWNQPTPKNLVAFAQARGISELFVSVPNNLPTSARLTWVKSVSTVGWKLVPLYVGAQPSCQTGSSPEKITAAKKIGAGTRAM